jgi:hypothetical protein
MGDIVTLKPTLYDTDSDQRVSVSLDIGQIPAGYPGVGQYVVTIQVHPIPQLNWAQDVAANLKQAIEGKLGVRLNVME